MTRSWQELPLIPHWNDRSVHSLSILLPQWLLSLILYMLSLLGRRLARISLDLIVTWRTLILIPRNFWLIWHWCLGACCVWRSTICSAGGFDAWLLTTDGLRVAQVAWFTLKAVAVARRRYMTVGRRRYGYEGLVELMKWFVQRSRIVLLLELRP